jgi:hypothetical protein
MKLHTIADKPETHEVRLSSFPQTTTENTRVIEFVGEGGISYRLELNQSELAHLNTVVGHALASTIA